MSKATVMSRGRGDFQESTLAVALRSHLDRPATYRRYMRRLLHLSVIEEAFSMVDVTNIPEAVTV